MRGFTLVVLAVAAGLAFAVSPYASSSADGLEKVAAQQGFLDGGRPAGVQEEAPIPDYAFPGIEDARVATGVAGFVGTLAVFAVAHGLARVVARRRVDPAAPVPGAPGRAG